MDSQIQTPLPWETWIGAGPPVPSGAVEEEGPCRDLPGASAGAFPAVHQQQVIMENGWSKGRPYLALSSSSATTWL